MPHRLSPVHWANSTRAPAHTTAPASTAACAQTPSHALPFHHLLRNAPSRTTPTHACAHAPDAATPGPQTGAPPENGLGHARTKTTATAAPAPNNPPQRPRPPRGDQNLARKASTHLCLPADRPWPRAGPKRGAGIRPKKRVTKYVPQQLGDTVRDSKLGPPNGPLKNALRQALLPARKRPHARKTNTTSPLSRQGNAQAHHN